MVREADVARTLYGRAAYEGTACCAVGTATHGNVIDNIADGVLATCARTGIETLAAQTGLVTRTVRVEHTLWTTAGVGIAMELGQAAADTVVALGIGATWRRLAAIDIFVWVMVNKMISDVDRGEGTG